jgi:ABC-2 type transport system ATP-binding protein
VLKPDSGSIRVHGEAPTSKQARQVGYMPQLSALYQELSIRENVDFFGRMYGMSDKSERAAAVDDAIKSSVCGNGETIRYWTSAAVCDSG